MPAFLDLVGARFGRLFVVSCAGRKISKSKKSSDTVWLCKCDCGNHKEVTRGNLKNGSTLSCGCVRNTQGALTRKHPLWKRWDSMIDRCLNKDSKDYPNYGERGITVCERWMKFPLFLEDMEASFFEGATLDRENNDGNYDPKNVRWATQKEQSRNKRDTVFMETPWGYISRGEAAERSGLSIGAIKSRMRCGWSSSEIFSTMKRAA